MELRLDGKTALVTGGSRGIGKGIARVFADAGARVMITSRKADACAAAADEIGNGCVWEAGHVGKPDDAERIVDACIERIGGVDILVNNAGIQHVAPVEEFPVEKWDAIIAINLNSAFHTIRAAIPGMKSRGWGRIVNIASAHSKAASPFKSAYVAAKHGIVGLTKTVALEVAEQGITVNAVSPGYVLTPLVAAQIPDTARARGLSEEEVKRDVRFQIFRRAPFRAETKMTEQT